MRIVSNTSPLVFLAKLGKLEFLDRYEILVPTRVIDELGNWEKTGKETYALLAKWLRNANVSIKESSMLLDLPKNLDDGEKAALSLAIQEKVRTILIDERKARAAAKIRGLRAIGTLAIIKQQFEQKMITNQECKHLVFELVKNGYRIREELLAEFLQSIEK